MKEFKSKYPKGSKEYLFISLSYPSDFNYEIDDIDFFIKNIKSLPLNKRCEILMDIVDENTRDGEKRNNLFKCVKNLPKDFKYIIQFHNIIEKIRNGSCITFEEENDLAIVVDNEGKKTYNIQELVKDIKY